MLIREEKGRKQRSEECLLLQQISEASPHFPLPAERLSILSTPWPKPVSGWFRAARSLSLDTDPGKEVTTPNKPPGTHRQRGEREGSSHRQNKRLQKGT